MTERMLAEEIFDNERDQGATEVPPRPKNAHGLLDEAGTRDAREQLTRLAAFARWS